MRSWPQTIPQDRSYVVDDLERVVIDKHDHRPLCDLDLDGVFLLEWDLAISPEAALFFEHCCLAQPRRVRVGAYRLYGHRGDSWWAHWQGGGTHDLRFVDFPDPVCDGFGFGCIYLPMQLLRRWREERDEPLTDLNFSLWHIAAGCGWVPIEWAVRPVHLHWSWQARPYRPDLQKAMIDDARVGDDPAVLDDAQAGSNPLFRTQVVEDEARAAEKVETKAPKEEVKANEERRADRRSAGHGQRR